MASNQNQPESITSADFMKLVEALKESALTTDKIAALARELNRPYVDEAATAREKKERAQLREQMRQSLENKRQRQENCPHKYSTNAHSISIVRNFPDHMPRGVCMKCHCLIEPEHFDYDSEGKAFKIAAHPQYDVVLLLDAATIS